MWLHPCLWLVCRHRKSGGNLRERSISYDIIRLIRTLICIMLIKSVIWLVGLWGSLWDKMDSTWCCRASAGFTVVLRQVGRWHFLSACHSFLRSSLETLFLRRSTSGQRFHALRTVLPDIRVWICELSSHRWSTWCWYFSSFSWPSLFPFSYQCCETQPSCGLLLLLCWLHI